MKKRETTEKTLAQKFATYLEILTASLSTLDSLTLELIFKEWKVPSDKATIGKVEPLRKHTWLIADSKSFFNKDIGGGTTAVANGVISNVAVEK